jgi:hypothetical protein
MYRFAAPAVMLFVAIVRMTFPVRITHVAAASASATSAGVASTHAALATKLVVPFAVVVGKNAWTAPAAPTDSVPVPAVDVNCVAPTTPYTRALTDPVTVQSVIGLFAVVHAVGVADWMVGCAYREVK